MDGTDSVVSALYAELAKFGQNLEWQKGLKNANKILHHRPDDFKALQCKIVCMIQLSQFKEVINAIVKNPKVSKDLLFEHGYCLYRLNRIPEALTILQSADDADQKIQELKAQILYRLEKYNECFELYKDLIKNSQDEYDSERATNFSAVLSFCKTKNLSKDEVMNATRGHTYEITYNRACFLISQEKYTEAEEALLEAEGLCKKSFDDDEDALEEDIDAELEIIRIQSGFCKQMLKKKNEASQLYALVMKQKPSDAGLLAIVSNNVVVINKDRNIFESKKRMKSATAVGLEQKLTKSQLKTVSVNHCLFSLYTNQNEQCREQLKSLKKQYSNTEEITLIEAALLCREKKVEDAINLLKSSATAEVGDVPCKSFVLIQLLLAQGLVNDACNILTSLQRVSHKPGVVSALLTFYTHLSNMPAATSALETAVSWYKTSEPNSRNLINLLKESANFYLARANFAAAAKSLEELRKISPNDNKVVAKLVTAYSKFDQEKAKLFSKSLPTTEEMSKSIDVDNLENMAWSLGAKHFKKMGKAEDSPGKGVTSAKFTDDLLIKKKKKKKSKKNKKFVVRDPDAVLDPERWLPRRERSTYKKRKDRRGAGIGKGTQGATTVNTELDASVKFPSATDTPRAASNASSPQQDPRVHRAQQQARKKKKKGGKGW